MHPDQQRSRELLTPEDVRLAIEATRRLEYAISDENIARRNGLASPSGFDSRHVMSMPRLPSRHSSSDAGAFFAGGPAATDHTAQQGRPAMRMGGILGQRPLRASDPVLGSRVGPSHRNNGQRGIGTAYQQGSSYPGAQASGQSQYGGNGVVGGAGVLQVLADRGMLFADVAQAAVPGGSHADSSARWSQLPPRYMPEPTLSFQDHQAPLTTHQTTAVTTPFFNYRHPGQQAMGIVQTYGLSRTAGTGPDQNEEPHALTDSGSESDFESDSESCDSLMDDTPMIPVDVEEASQLPVGELQGNMPSTTDEAGSQAPREEHAPQAADNSLRSDSLVSDEADLLSKTAELSLTTNTAVTAGKPESSLAAASPKAKDATDSLIAKLMIQDSPPGSQNYTKGNTQPAQLLRTNHDLPRRPEPSLVDSNTLLKLPGPSGQSKKTGKSGKRNSKGHAHGKTSSVNSIKTVKSENGNLSSQGAQSTDESVTLTNPEGKRPDKSRPLPQRLHSEGHTASRRRRRNSSLTSISFAHKKVSPSDSSSLLPAPPATQVEPSMTGPPSDLEISRESSTTSIGYNQYKPVESAANNFSQRGPIENTIPLPIHNQTKAIDQGGQPQQFYTSPPNTKQWQRSFNGFQSLGPLQQTHQSSNSYNQSKNGGYRGSLQPPLQATHYHQNYQHPVRRNYESNVPYGTHRNQQQQQPQQEHQNQHQQSFQNYNSNFQYPQQQYHQPQYQQSQYQQSQYQQSQYQQQQAGTAYQSQAAQTAPPTPHRNHRYAANTGFNTSFARHNSGAGHARNNSFGMSRGHARQRSFQSQSENGANAFRPTLVQEERYRRRTPSPPPIVKLSVRDKKLLWPIGPFIPWNVWGCPPWEMDSTNFVNVLCTSVGILRLPFSIPFLRLLRSVLQPNHGDHVITFPTMLANANNMAPYWERCYYAQQFLWKNAKYFNWKPFEELPPSEWPKVEILLGSDNRKDSKWDVYLSQRDEKRLLFRCVEQKLSEDDKEPKATFFVTVHQTGVNQVQYSDPTTRDPDIPLPPLDGSPDPRLLPEYQYTLPNYLCLNESRGITTHGFVDIGVPAKRLNFHPFGPRNFDQLWYGMAHLQELVCMDDIKTLENLRPGQDADAIFGKGKAEELKERTKTMMGNGGPKFLTHEEILAMNFHTPSDE
ncbi:hypothetical protein TWF696_009029 [Orbilia brochopaga]|uniref:Uncharacterized protein n=1 Tax=Orbilia brochopaga TaxID=3140254 RepID=A0AAV9UFK1_9PEZI